MSDPRMQSVVSDPNEDESWLDWGTYMFLGLVVFIGLFALAGAVDWGTYQDISFWLVAAVSLYKSRKLKESLQSVEEPDPALEGDLDLTELHADPEQIERVRDDIESLGFIRTPNANHSGLEPRYKLFAVDTNGRTHAIEGKVRGPEEDAQWLAEQLDVPLRDERYG